MIELVASSVVVWQLRGEQGSVRERRALRVIAVAFGVLAVYIAVQAAVTVAIASRPRRSLLGVVWLGVTVGVMLALAAGKRRTGERLGNRVLVTEARVTVIDGLLAAAVLVGVALNAVAGWWWADPVCGLTLVFYGVREARHAWSEASSD